MMTIDLTRLEEDLNDRLGIVTLYYETKAGLQTFHVDHVWGLGKRWYFFVRPDAIVRASSEVYGKLSGQKWTEWQLDLSGSPPVFPLAVIRAIRISNTHAPVPREILWLRHRGGFERFHQ